MTSRRTLPTVATLLCAGTLMPLAARAAEGDDIVLLYTGRLANTLTLDKVTDPNTVAKARFFITTDGGRSWTLAQETVVTARPGTKPQLPRFAFTAPKDGMYGVMTCVTYRDGHAEPEPRPGQAPLYALVVDTIPPVVVRLAATLSSRSAATAVVHCAWSAIDANLADDPVTVEASTDDGAHFTPLFHGPGTGETDLAIAIGAKTAMIAVRITVIDRTHAQTTSANQIVALSDEAKALVAAASPAPTTKPTPAPTAPPVAAPAPAPTTAPPVEAASAQAKELLAQAAAELTGHATTAGKTTAEPAPGSIAHGAPVAASPAPAPITPAPVTPVAVATPVPVTAPTAPPVPTPAAAPVTEPQPVVATAPQPPAAAGDPLPAPAATPAPALAPVAALDPAPSPKPVATTPEPAPAPAPTAVSARPTPPPAPLAPVPAPAPAAPAAPVIVDGQRPAPEAGAFVGAEDAKQLLDDARTAARLDHVDEACDLYERLLNSPLSRPASGEAAKLLAKAGRPKDVLTLVDSLPIELHGDAVRLEQGRCLLALGRPAPAVTALSAVRGGAPESREAFYLIARAFALQGRSAESHKLLEHLASGTDAVAAAASADLRR